MVEGKEEYVMLGTNKGVLPGIGGGDLIWKGNFIGASNTEEQQLQIQNGEHRSSPQSLECCSWPEIC